MIMIVTDKIRLTNKELFNIFTTSYLKKRWWLLAWIWIMIVILLFRDSSDAFGYFIIAALIIIQLIVAYQYWSVANSKENEESFQERFYEIDSEKLVLIKADGTSNTIENGLFTSLTKTKRYYLLYTSKTEFIYLPFCSFKSAEDLKWFDSEIVEKIKR